jgi:hypothetical protein
MKNGAVKNCEEGKKESKLKAARVRERKRKMCE